MIGRKVGVYRILITSPSVTLITSKLHLTLLYYFAASLIYSVLRVYQGDWARTNFWVFGCTSPWAYSTLRPNACNATFYPLDHCSGKMFISCKRKKLVVKVFIMLPENYVTRKRIVTQTLFYFIGIFLFLYRIFKSFF